MPHHPAQRRAGPLRQQARSAALVRGAQQPDLHELVIAQGLVEGRGDGLGDAGLAHLDDGPQPVGLRPEEAALEALQGDRLAHGLRDARRGSARWVAPRPGHRALLLTALLLALASACATSPGPGLAPGHLEPRFAEPLLHHPVPPGQPLASAPPGPFEAPELGSLGPADVAAYDVVHGVLEARAPDLGPLAREGVARVLAQAEAKHGLPALLVLAVIEQESRFAPAAHGPRGAVGLMQVRPFVAQAVARRHDIRWRGEATLRDPVTNVQIGCAYLSDLKERFGTAELALAAYSIGPARAQRRLKRGHSLHGPYVRSVLAHYRDLRMAFGDPETAVGG